MLGDGWCRGTDSGSEAFFPVYVFPHIFPITPKAIAYICYMDIRGASHVMVYVARDVSCPLGEWVASTIVTG